MPRAATPVAALAALLCGAPAPAAAIPEYFSFYGHAPAAQHEWSNLGIAGLPEIVEAWGQYGQVSTMMPLAPPCDLHTVY